MAPRQQRTAPAAPHMRQPVRAARLGDCSDVHQFVFAEIFFLLNKVFSDHGHHHISAAKCKSADKKVDACQP